MTQHLLDTGRKRIAFGAAQLDPRVMQRLAGYRDAMQQANRYDPTLEWLNPAPSSLALGAEMLEAIISQHEDVDAIFFCNDDLAQGGLLAALRLQLPVPQRVAIAGFNDLAGSAYMVPPLTTIRTPRVAIGEHAAAMLLSPGGAGGGAWGGQGVGGLAEGGQTVAARNVDHIGHHRDVV
jgi:LacI family gluconate utilization system Gnt-I transcriptional repressor